MNYSFLKVIWYSRYIEPNQDKQWFIGNYAGNIQHETFNGYVEICAALHDNIYEKLLSVSRLVLSLSLHDFQPLDMSHNPMYDAVFNLKYRGDGDFDLNY